MGFPLQRRRDPPEADKSTLRYDRIQGSWERLQKGRPLEIYPQFLTDKGNLVYIILSLYLNHVCQSSHFF